MFVELIALGLFSLIMFLIFVRILKTTRSMLIFLSVLFATYVVFNYVFKTVNIVYDSESLPVVSNNDLDKYNMEAGVELREYNLESFIGNGDMNNENNNENNNVDDYNTNNDVEEFMV